MLATSWVGCVAIAVVAAVGWLLQLPELRQGVEQSVQWLQQKERWPQPLQQMQRCRVSQKGLGAGSEAHQVGCRADKQVGVGGKAQVGVRGANINTAAE